METIAIILGAICIVYYGIRLRAYVIAKRIDYVQFVTTYGLVRAMLAKRFYTYLFTKKCLYNKVDDAITLAGIVQTNIKNEDDAMAKNMNKFFKKLYKEYKKEKDFQTFINKHFIGIANFLRCYGDTDWNVLADIKKMTA